MQHFFLKHFALRTHTTHLQACCNICRRDQHRLLPPPTTTFIRATVTCSWHAYIRVLLILAADLSWPQRTSFLPPFTSIAARRSRTTTQSSQHTTPPSRSSDAAPSRSFGSSFASVITAVKRTVKVILANPDSRKIFQFLMLNLAFHGRGNSCGVSGPTVSV